ncbi:GAF domain-containing protein [Dyadobacter flavalbus]|uniref:GAF domain-containing protein n=1 Tax=Dyadobacter flavalbus TaxID=2579942 RepID=A0A5M8QI94_9BACT|nr:GAF domain-containing protein [Dyadobacter flavalbus]KAA6434092.1 GAF domain-containing protein [Dyadobacter flavalbus]
MELITVDVTQNTPYGLQKMDSSVSFRNFISFLESKADQEETVKRTFFSLVLERLKAEPGFNRQIPLTEVAAYKDQLGLVYGMLVPPVADENNVYWALSVPLGPVVFYGTAGFYNLITDQTNAGNLRCDLIDDKGITVRHKMQMLYAFILERLYHFPPVHQSDMIVTLKDDHSGLQKFYRLNVDNRFCDVYPKEALPELNLNEMRQDLMESFNLDVITRLLPVDLFRFEGFSIVTMTDVTGEHALEDIKSTILERQSYEPAAYFRRINESLKMLVENAHIDFGMLPVLKVNNKLVFDRNTLLYSKLMQTSTESSSAEEMYLSMAAEYFRNPKIFFMRNLDTENEHKKDLVKKLRSQKIESFALLPVYYDNNAIGVLEVYSRIENSIDEKALARLDSALPLISQIMKNYIDEFNANIENVIREKFTSLQPAVQWRFRETAWHFLRDKAANPQNAVIENIHFKNVYPLYGAIDIRNSTVERNLALKKDLQLQFNVLTETFTALKQKLGFGLADEMTYKCKKWFAEIYDQATDSDEMKVRDFLDFEAHPFLQHFRENGIAEYSQNSAGQNRETSEIRDIIDRYFEITDEQHGAAFANRRALETSMQQINSSVNLYLDLFKTEIQQSYPCYFEKFRTDGIEYDIYIGQSIKPDQKFSELYLKNIRLWQLTSMAAITKITSLLIPKMEKPLETTQLIFIHSSSIDISFRDDERRFDVEGAYNIRYQVIKKRIDKVRVKGTGERLTQPGKIAMVYFNEKSSEEYVGYIRYLQEKNTLCDDLEYLELEELQGVTGLKALRIGVNLENEWS